MNSEKKVFKAINSKYCFKKRILTDYKNDNI